MEVLDHQNPAETMFAQPEPYGNQMSDGTTLACVKYDGGILICSDSRTTMVYITKFTIISKISLKYKGIYCL